MTKNDWKKNPIFREMDKGLLDSLSESLEKEGFDPESFYKGIEIAMMMMSDVELNSLAAAVEKYNAPD